MPSTWPGTPVNHRTLSPHWFDLLCENTAGLAGQQEMAGCLPFGETFLWGFSLQIYRGLFLFIMTISSIFLPVCATL